MSLQTNVRNKMLVIPFYSWKLLIVKLSQTAQSKILTEAQTVLEEDDQHTALPDKVFDPERGPKNIIKSHSTQKLNIVCNICAANKTVTLH